MAYIENTDISCGVRQVAEIGDGDGLQEMYSYLKYSNCAVFLWSDGVEYKQGATLAKTIRKAGLGSGLIRTRTCLNPNSRNAIAVWAWAFPRKAFIDYGRKMGW